jgi:hypothetical protein
MNLGTIRTNHEPNVRVKFGLYGFLQAGCYRLSKKKPLLSTLNMQLTKEEKRFAQNRFEAFSFLF